jgi:hypothetical protein
MSKISKEDLEKIQNVEFAISKNLFAICFSITVVVMSMFVVGFFSKGAFPPPGMNIFYIGILFLYSVHKEMLRWLEEKRVERKGEWFVYSWIILTIVIYLVNFLTKNQFCNPENSNSMESLREITVTSLEVCAIFILTRLSKVIKITSEKRK